MFINGGDRKFGVNSSSKTVARTHSTYSREIWPEWEKNVRIVPAGLSGYANIYHSPSDISCWLDTGPMLASIGPVSSQHKMPDGTTRHHPAAPCVRVAPLRFIVWSLDRIGRPSRCSSYILHYWRSQTVRWRQTCAPCTRWYQARQAVQNLVANSRDMNGEKWTCWGWCSFSQARFFIDIPENWSSDSLGQGYNIISRIHDYPINNITQGKSAVEVSQGHRLIQYCTQNWMNQPVT